MLTLGIDLAAQPKETAACRIRWTSASATVELASCDNDDPTLVELSRGAEAVGIDCPFGWPDPFVASLSNHHAMVDWPIPWSSEAYGSHCLRRTDHFVNRSVGIQPLSVSSNFIAITAMRCAWLLSKLGVQDRSGDGRVFEVYPAAALSIWKLRGKKGTYKRRAGRANLATLLERLRTTAPWLAFADTAPTTSFTNDHLFDALISALNARAAALRLTHRPSEQEAELARKEGWIALPRAESLGALLRNGSPSTLSQ